MGGNETVLDVVCKQCINPAFVKIVEGFRKPIHQGSELKKRKKQLPSMRIEFITEISCHRMNGSVAIRNGKLSFFPQDCVQKLLE